MAKQFNLYKRSLGHLGEDVYTFTLTCGLNVIVIPQQKFTRTYASFAVNYGSDDICFMNKGDVVKTILPYGTAHFLEHKLFEQKKKNAMEAFGKLGAMSNAGTGHTSTKYYFSCVDNFEECLMLLMDFVTNPYIAEENVEKEKGIIAEEIKMYDDNPDARGYQNLMRGLYKSSYAKEDIAGKVSDIQKLNKDILLHAYNSFYTPENSVLVISGNVNPTEVAELLEDRMSIEFNGSELPERVVPNETGDVAEKYIEESMPTSKTQFYIGYKLNEKKFTGKDIATKIAALDIADEMFAGTSSDFYNKMYESGLVNREFGLFNTVNRTAAFNAFNGESDDPQRVLEEIQKEAEFRKANGFSKKEFDMVRNAYMANIVKMVGNPANVNSLFTVLYNMGADLFDYFDCCAKITLADCEESFRMAFNTEKVLSVIKPINK